MAALLSRFDVVILSDDAIARASLGKLASGTCAIAILHIDLDGQYRNSIGDGRDCDRFVAVSEAIRCHATDVVGCKVSDVVHIPSGVEIPTEWPKERNRESGPLRLCYLGRFSDWHKGVFALPEIMCKAGEWGADVDLDIVGEGPDKGEMLRRFDAADLHGRYHMKGSLDRTGVTRILTAADVLILPSNFEGFPIAPLEAMAQGVVPIVTLLPKSTDSMINHWVNGVLIRKGDYAGFARALVVLSQNRDKLREMSRAAWERAKDEYSIDAMARRYLGLLDELLARADRPGRSGMIDTSLLGDLPWLASGLVRPVRKLARYVGMWPQDRA